MKGEESMESFQNIYTGEKVKDKFESLGYAKYTDSNKKIHLKKCNLDYMDKRD